METAKCDNCGNLYDQMMQIRYQGEALNFDCFECAIQALAPRCEHCGTRIIGHGLQAGEKMFCCAHCAEAKGLHLFRDRAN